MAKAKSKAAPKERPAPSEAETEAGKRATARVLAMPTRPTIDLSASGLNAVSIAPGHNEVALWRSHLQEAFGSRSFDYVDEAIGRLVAATRTKGDPPTSAEANAGLALLASIEPQNELEAAIGEQIVAAHLASLDFLRRARANAGDYANTANVYANMANKTSRTMAAHVEALTKLRSGGKQTHEVRYVYVNGPAAFGPGAKAAATYGGEGVRGENLEQPHTVPALGHDPGAPCPPVWRQDAEGDALSVASGGGPEAVQDARGHESGRPSGEG